MSAETERKRRRRWVFPLSTLCFYFFELLPPFPTSSTAASSSLSEEFLRREFLLSFLSLIFSVVATYLVSERETREETKKMHDRFLGLRTRSSNAQSTFSYLIFFEEVKNRSDLQLFCVFCGNSTVGWKKNETSDLHFILLGSFSIIVQEIIIKGTLARLNPYPFSEYLSSTVVDADCFLVYGVAGILVARRVSFQSCLSSINHPSRSRKFYKKTTTTPFPAYPNRDETQKILLAHEGVPANSNKMFNVHMKRRPMTF